MSDLVPVTPVTQAVAQGLLAAAEALGLEPGVVQGPFTREPQGFRVPPEVADKYLEMTSAPDVAAEPEPEPEEIPEGVFSELKADDEGYEPALDASIAYDDLESADKAKRTRKINEVKAAAEAGTQE